MRWTKAVLGEKKSERGEVIVAQGEAAGQDERARMSSDLQ
jgi:hypothetical protein